MSENKRDLMPYRLFYCEPRLLVQNIDGHVVDIGSADKVEGKFHWQLDGNDQHGEQAKTVEAMFDDIKQHLSFLFVDGQFTSLPDVSADYSEQLESVPSQQFQLHELNDNDEESVR
ncbi:MAG: hypothetical protein QRY16_19530 [Enterobacterales bacterium endosymbiont of Blomia tropicalis]|uniref:hypothetical protein n=1 Tax=Mixta mediterraneensis TaxID=2758443 RepID=UPI0025A7B1CF|nr:hypothetical protein [Mixta mediterraneensis]MDL4915878.1 hypothetical protein [Mixta mediterraneensis]